VAAAVLAPATLLAGSVTLPSTFANGTVADADAVNANFSAIETAVDDNDTRLATLEAAVASLQSADTVLEYAQTYTQTSTLVANAPRRTYIDSTIEVTAPSDGTYRVSFDARMYGLQCSGADTWWKARVANAVTGTEYVDSFGFNCGDVALNGDTNVSGERIVALSAGDTLQLQYYIDGAGTSTVVLADGNGGHGVTLIRLGD
jgi:hypothetical protein